MKLEPKERVSFREIRGGTSMMGELMSGTGGEGWIWTKMEVVASNGV